MKCYECGGIVEEGDCTCSSPRPKPPNAKYDSLPQQKAAEEAKEEWQVIVFAFLASILIFGLVWLVMQFVKGM